MRIWLRNHGLLAALLLAALLLVGCGRTPEPTATPEPTPTDVPTPTTAPPPTDAPPPSLAVTSLQDVGKATIQIEAQGSFQDPELGEQLNQAGSGSGFIIDPSGLAVTNNHVVTGAAFLKVYVGERSRNARILGVSECSDLAVIDLEGDGYPYLEWYDGAISPGLDVYAAGFPLGDPEFTLTRGIISKARADGESEWASVDAVLEHDATIQPGNSGGPLVTADGKVVGVNYAYSTVAEQYFAISRDEAVSILDRLAEGEDVDSLGLNALAFAGGDQPGIWVSSVASGSPADKAGVKAGDIVTKLEGLLLATDGTMADYCDILRSRDPEKDTLSLQVIRPATEELLEGQVNGRELAVAFSFAEELGADAGDTGATYEEYVTVTDDTDSISIEIPTAWDDVGGGPWARDGEDIGVSIAAAPDLDGFFDAWETPGVFFGASKSMAAQFDPAGMLDEFRFDDACTLEDRYDYDDGLYTGFYDFYLDCDTAGSQFVNLAAMPEDKSFIILVQVVVVNEEDLDALDHIINTFQAIAELP